MRATIPAVSSIALTADQIVSALAQKGRNVSILDSCGIARGGSSLLIAGIDPINVISLDADDSNSLLDRFDRSVGRNDVASIFTISYDLGPKLMQLEGPVQSQVIEPDVYIAQYDSLLIHDHLSGETKIVGSGKSAARLQELLINRAAAEPIVSRIADKLLHSRSNFTKDNYIAAVEIIKDRIRRGDTYQTNLTQKLTVEMPNGRSPIEVFQKLRRDHPAPFAAFLDRVNSTVVSASPEHFIGFDRLNSGSIVASPIKGTRRRGTTPEEDDLLRKELAESEKDRAENTMIVDLTRNDLGRICEFGSVEVAELCRLEEHPTLFHLVSIVKGKLLNGLSFSDVLRAVFPCGSITGAPKISTMKIITELEPDARGLSMGAIGIRIPPEIFVIDEKFEMNVAIRTMVFRDNTAEFNVGGGIVIESDPELEYQESLLKASALLKALGAKPPGN